MRILGISGSLRQASTNTRLLEAAASYLPASVHFDLFSALNQLPHFNPDVAPEDCAALMQFIAVVKAADGLIISTPEYARGYPGSLKNALDWLVGTDAFIEKPFMLLNASERATHAQTSLIVVLTTMSGIHIENASATIHLLGKTLRAEQILENREYANIIQTSLTTFLHALASKATPQAS